MPWRRPTIVAACDGCLETQTLVLDNIPSCRFWWTTQPACSAIEAIRWKERDGKLYCSVCCHDGGRLKRQVQNLKEHGYG